MPKHLLKLTLCCAAAALLASCDALSVPGTPRTYEDALKYDVSFTAYAVTTRIILANEAGCDQFSGGWQDEKNIQNLLFVGDEKYQKWASPGKYVQDGVAMAMFWNRQVRFVFACKKNDQFTYSQTDWGSLDQNSIRSFGNNLVLRVRMNGNKMDFMWNYPLNP